MHPLLAAVVTDPSFLEAATPQMLLNAQLDIVAVNAAYMRATDRPADEMVGRWVFDAFPDNPDDPAATGEHNLGLSLEHVLRSRKPHDMFVQRYDVQSQSAQGRFVTKVWSPLHVPVLDQTDGVVGVVQRAEDITDLFRAMTDRSTEVEGGAPPARDDAIRSSSTAGTTTDRHSRPVQSALSSVVASRGMFGIRNERVDRRCRLWHEVSGDAANGDWTGWTAAVCRRLVAQLPGIDAAAVSVRSGRAQDVVAATAPWAYRLEQLHCTIGEGPAAIAHGCGVPVLVPDVRQHHDRWPGYIEAVGSQVRGVFVLPLHLDGAPIGTLTMYSRTRIPLTGDDWVDAMILADLLVSALLIDLDSAPLDPSLTGGYHRVSIAAGITATDHRISVDGATSLLRAHAYTTGRALLDVADDVIAGRLRLDG